MKKNAVLGTLLAVVILVTTGCASRGEGLTLNSDGLHVGTSLARRDQIAQDKADAEIARLAVRMVIEQDRAAASIGQSAAMGEVTRPVVLAIGLAAAVGLAAIGIGYGIQRTAPALKVALDIRKSRQLEVILEIGPGGYSAKLLTTGYDPGEIAQIVQAAPALDAPRLQELQGRIGDRGMRLLADRDEVEEALALLPEIVEGEVTSQR